MPWRNCWKTTRRFLIDNQTPIGFKTTIPMSIARRDCFVLGLFSSSESVSDGEIDADLFGTIRPLHGKRNRAHETVVGIAQPYTGKVLAVMNTACLKWIEGIQKIVGGCDIMLLEESVSEIATRNSREVFFDIVDMVDADEGELVLEMPPSDFASDDVPKVGIGSPSKQASGVKLWNDGEPFVIGCDVALDAITDFVCCV